MRRAASRTILATLLAASVALSAQSRRGADSQSFPVKNGGRLNVRLPGGDIRVEVWSNPEILVRTVDLGSVTAREVGGEVTVRANGHVHWHEGRVDAKVPARCDLDLSTASGSIEIQGDIRGNATLSTNTGDISMGRVDGAATARTAGGDIDVGDVSSDADLRTSGGDVFVGSVGGQAHLFTSGGDVRVNGVGGRLEAWTSGGEVIAGRIGGDADLGTAGGDIRVDSIGGRGDLRTSGGDIEVRGLSGSIAARTSGGDVFLREATGTVEARSAGGDIVVRLIPDRSGNSLLQTQAGDIELSLPASASVTVEVVIHVQGHWSSTTYKIRSDFGDPSPRSDPRRKEVRATQVINGGGHHIFIEATNGDIRIRKR